jgi:hypothetical protein
MGGSQPLREVCNDSYGSSVVAVGYGFIGVGSLLRAVTADYRDAGVEEPSKRSRQLLDQRG